MTSKLYVHKMFYEYHVWIEVDGTITVSVNMRISVIRQPKLKCIDLIIVDNWVYRFKTVYMLLNVTTVCSERVRGIWWQVNWQGYKDGERCVLTVY